ncbi:MAG: hypothetical protein J6U94_03470 [Paludibacteraceae bacterium]|nr:hypothetical protein [Paludibacteraceae bacterium]
MKKSFLFMMAALVVAAFTFSSCEPQNQPNGDEPQTDQPDTDDPSTDDPIQQSQWEQINADIQSFFQTTESIPEPAVEYEVVTTQKQAGNQTWVSGMYIITFKGDALINYATTLEAAGYVKNDANSQAEMNCYVGPKDYIIFLFKDNNAAMQIYKKSDVL